jgi:hypothetical protein
LTIIVTIKNLTDGADVHLASKSKSSRQANLRLDGTYFTRKPDDCLVRFDEPQRLVIGLLPAVSLTSN